ncbi:tRNA (N6-isopentenyl adenosine(37)-C2)-methylthiotransferase MiaB [Neobittarella massiliensis]|uniref:tRNA (N6-isopentenyl adenosine(37)-C2)-methylthiotransferase MiaB n=1 Tax=Neobittarella massiliensis (ex Bilen et al. 2018) TaxID=2041842 RepID=UPI001A9BA0BB|nr:tRNA (N6-isopentenyl adenosine(37)-C2)-methylthiotransferase MiaB [Neobittarella massiliensis]
MEITGTGGSQQFDSRLLDSARQLIQRLFGDRIPLAHVHSYGCQGNVSDGEKISGLLAQMGYGFTADPGRADLVIYNTCAIREHAEEKLFGNVGALKHAKRRNPDMVIGLCGCMMQQPAVAEKIKKSYPYVDLVFGTHALQNLPQNLCELLQGRQQGKKRVFDTDEQKNIIYEGIPTRREGSLKAWVPIMYGCDNFCSYCVVPLVRGREVSRQPADVLREIEQLVGQGYRDITLLGQNVNSYGKGLAEPCDFADLLQRICQIPGDFWIRFMTSHPKDITHKLIDTIAQNDKLCNHIHLPVQSGCDRVLREMNRHYDVEKYLSIVDYARQKIPAVSFTSDIIVGFPGEQYEEFLQTVDLIKKVRYDSLFTFIFSPRPGTRAAKMEDPVPAKEKSRWFGQLLEVQRQVGRQRYGELVGQTVRVLCEGPGKTGPGYMSGRDEHNMVVDFIGDSTLCGHFVTVEVDRVASWALVGHRVD